ncbi:MAG: hypothetical protein CTY10_02410 [Methylotenera sp.]|nr:MAG: hypothetical protein CTY10_02410 [Methylotenera sp.]
MAVKMASLKLICSNSYPIGSITADGLDAIKKALLMEVAFFCAALLLCAVKKIQSLKRICILYLHSIYF